MLKNNVRSKIEYYCFPSKTGTISVFTDLEQYTDYREKEYYYITQEDVLAAKEIDKLLIFDLRNNTFIDINALVVDIKGKLIFPRATIQDSYLLLDFIEKAGGISITKKDDISIVENWFDFIPTLRGFEKTTFGELQSNINNLEAKYGQYFFVKTVKKGFSSVCSIFKIETPHVVTENTLSSDDISDTKTVSVKFIVDSSFHSISLGISDSSTKLIVSKKVDICKDTFGKREWRAFVVFNELFCLSRCSDDVIPIEDYVYEKVNLKIQEFAGKLPSSYVVDFFEYLDDTDIIFDVIEFNPITSSGPYQNNDLVF